MSKARDNAIAADDVDAIELDYYRTDNILGTVSASSPGVPTGAIFESGSNANGEYVKYADGWVLITGRYTGGIAMGAYGTALNVGAYTATLPVTIVGDTDRVLSFSGNNNAGQGWGGKGPGGGATTSRGFNYFSTTASVTATDIHWSIIARWY